MSYPQEQHILGAETPVNNPKFMAQCAEIGKTIDRLGAKLQGVIVPINQILPEKDPGAISSPVLMELKRIQNNLTELLESISY